uniref:Uncharacterized protein n=1 Tax=Lactuca sativa TaxID=4236 RepID=A0A9R1V1J7_LACSA|nr:hypothetical protein LSAT_V11C700375580 [Lactuca sativa]
MVEDKKKKAKQKHDKALRSEATQVLNDSVEIEDSLGMKAPSYIGPVDGYANKINPKIMKEKGRKVDLNDVVRKERILACHKFISRWAYKTAIPFHALEDDSFKMMLEVVGHFGIGLPPPSRSRWTSKEEYKFSRALKGRASYGTVTSLQFWAYVTQCLKVFSPLVKVLRMVDADRKPSMGCVYGELKVAKEEIMKALGGNEKAYKPIIDIINHKMKDFETQRQVVMIDLPKYKEKVDRFGADLAIKGCMFMGLLKELEHVHKKKRNRFETNRLNNPVYVQFNANLMEKNKKRKDRTLEVLLANDSHSAQEWMIDGDDCDGDEVNPESVMKMIDEAPGTNNNQNEEQMFEEDEYESDELQIVEELED